MICLLYVCVGLSKLFDESNVLLQDSLSIGGDADLMHDGRDAISSAGEYHISDMDSQWESRDVRNTTRPRWSVSIEGEKSLDVALNRSEKIAAHANVDQVLGLSRSEARPEEREEAKAREAEAAAVARGKETVKAHEDKMKQKADKEKKAREAAAGARGARLKAMVKARSEHVNIACSFDPREARAGGSGVGIGNHKV